MKELNPPVLDMRSNSPQTVSSQVKLKQIEELCLHYLSKCLNPSYFIAGNFFAGKSLATDSPASCDIENENHVVDSSILDNSRRKIYPLNEDAESDDSGSG